MNHLKVVTRSPDLEDKKLDLHTAIVDGSYDDIEKCLKEGQQCKQPNENGWLPIHLAAMRGRNDVESVIDLLVREGADVNAEGAADGSTPLHLTVRYTELVRAETIILKLLQHNADPDIRDRNLRRPYDYALERDYIELAALLAGDQPIEHVIRQLKLNKEKYYGEKLIKAVLDGDEDWLNVAIERANVDQLNQYGAAAIHYAITHCPLTKIDVLQKLVDHKADVNILTYEKDTALNLVIKTESLRENDQMYLLAGKLLEWGTHCNLKDLDGKDARTLAEEKGYADIVTLLDSHKNAPPKVDLNNDSDEDDEIVNIESDHDSNVDAEPVSNDNGLDVIKESPEPSEAETPQVRLFKCILHGTPEEVEEVLKGDISLEEYNEDGLAALHLAIMRNDSEGKSEIIKQLLDNGCNPNSTTVLANKTALHIAAEKTDLVATRALKDNGVGIDLSLTNQSGKTAYDLAAAKSPPNEEILVLLAPTLIPTSQEQSQQAEPNQAAPSEEKKKKGGPCVVM